MREGFAGGLPMRLFELVAAIVGLFWQAITEGEAASDDLFRRDFQEDIPS